MGPTADSGFRKSEHPKSTLLLVLLTLLAVGCDLNPNPVVNVNQTPTRPPLPTATRPAQRSGGTLTVRLLSDPGTLNPWVDAKDQSVRAITGLIFNGLTRLDDHLQPQPDLAESWDVSEDGTALTFHLRQGVQWHDGREFTAEDVIWSYNTLARLSASTPALLHIQDTLSSVQAVEPVSYTVRFNLKRRYSPLLADLAMPVLPKHLLADTPPDKL